MEKWHSLQCEISMNTTTLIQLNFNGLDWTFPEGTDPSAKLYKSTLTLTPGSKKPLTGGSLEVSESGVEDTRKDEIKAADSR